MNWDDARLFLTVAREGRMLAAGKRLGVNQATLSRRLTAMERGLQTTLMTRGPWGCLLTAEGQALMAHLERAEAAMQEGEALFTGAEAQLSGTVRIGAPDGFGVQFLAPRLEKLAAKHPDLRVELAPAPRNFSLSQREADIAVLVGRPESGRTVSGKLTDYSLSLYAARRYLERMGAPADEAELARHRLIGYVEDLLFTPSLDYGAEFFGALRPNLAVSSALGQMQAVRSGGGIGVLHDYLADGDDELQRVLPERSITRAYWIAWHESQRGNRRIRAVTDFIREEVSAASGWLRADA